MIRPIGDRILVKMLEVIENKSAGGIILTKQVTEITLMRGLVCAVGSGRLTNDGMKVASDVKVDDIVTYDRRAGAAIDNDDDCAGYYIMLREQDIIAVIE